MAGLAVGLVAMATGAGPGGWEHVGTGTAATSRRSTAPSTRSTRTGRADCSSAGRSPTPAATPNADYIARWDGTTWKALGAPPLNGAVNAIAYAAARSTSAASSRTPAATRTPTTSRSGTAGVGAGLQRDRPAHRRHRLRAGDRRLDALRRRHVPERRRDRHRRLPARLRPEHGRAARRPSAPEPMIGGGVYALDRRQPRAPLRGRRVRRRPGRHRRRRTRSPTSTAAAGTRSAAGRRRAARPSDCSCAASPRAGPNVYVGTDSVDIAGIPQADHVAKWNGSAWSALGSNTAGGRRLVPAIGVRLRADDVRIARLRRRRRSERERRPARRHGSRSSTERAGSRSARTAPATARSTATSTRSPCSSGGSTPAAASANAGGDRLARFLASYPLARRRPAAAAHDHDDARPRRRPPPTGTATGTVLVNGRAVHDRHDPVRRDGRRHARRARRSRPTRAR